MRLHAVAAVFAAVAVSAGAAQADSLNDRAAELRDELGERRAQIERAHEQEGSLAAEIAAQSDGIATAQARVDTLGAEVATLERQADASRARLARLGSALAEQTRALKRLRGELAVARARLERRVVELYVEGEPQLIDVLLGAETLSSLIDTMSLYSQIVEQDERLVGSVESGRARVRALRARTADLAAEERSVAGALAAQVAQRRQTYAAVVAERNQLASLRSSRERTLASVQVRREDWEAEAAALEAESARVTELLRSAPPPPPSADAAAGSPAAPAPAPSAGFIWPVRGPVTSPFGQRWGRLHAGIDIDAPDGAPIAASASGTVVLSGWMNGYGNIVIVQHANGIATAYAHNSANAVTVGQQVAQGQTIAFVGCTGNCTGTIVHFEVRVGGSPVDPMGYL